VHTHRQHRQQANVPSLTDEVETELAKYLAAPCQLRASDPLTWWRDNTARFLFSVTPLDITWQPLRLACLVSISAGDIADDKRTCLLAENLERLVFLKENLM